MADLPMSALLGSFIIYAVFHISEEKGTLAPDEKAPALLSCPNKVSPPEMKDEVPLFFATLASLSSAAILESLPAAGFPRRKYWPFVRTPTSRHAPRYRTQTPPPRRRPCTPNRPHARCPRTPTPAPSH